MIETTRMSSKGQVVIPSRIRKEIGAERNEVFLVSTLGQDTIVLKRFSRAEGLKILQDIRANSIKMSEEEIDREIHAYRAEQAAKNSSRH